MTGRYRVQRQFSPQTEIGRSHNGTGQETGTYTYVPSAGLSECYDNTNPGPPYTSGGPLTVYKARSYFEPSAYVGIDGFYGGYRGSFIPGTFGITPILPSTDAGTYHQPYGSSGQTSNTHSGSVNQDEGDNVSLGITGYSRAKPGAPLIDLGVILSELRSMPSVPGTSIAKTISGLGERARNFARSAKDAGSEALNIEFGWKPFLKDMAKLCDIQDKLDAAFAQLRRDNGRGIRRRVPLMSETIDSVYTNESGLGNVLWPTNVHAFYIDDNSGWRKLVISDVEAAWFVGKFRYYIPDIDTDSGRNRIIRKLLGLNPDPNTLWNATPWTWFIDYFTNAGDLMSNLSDGAAENLVCDYGYVMHETNRLLRYSCGQSITSQGFTGSVSAAFCREFSLKTRVVASPFGFGLTPGDLSDRQAGILAALGVSRYF